MKREGGYTLVEAALAIAVSASLVLLTVGLTTMVGNQRFRSSMTSIQSFVQTQYSEVRDSINSRMKANMYLNAKASGTTNNYCSTTASAAGNDSDCYIIGRGVVFHTDYVSSGYSIISPYCVGAKCTSKDYTREWPDYNKSGWENITGHDVLGFTSETNLSDAGLNPSVKKYDYNNQMKKAWIIDDESVVASTNGSSSSVVEYVILRSPTDGAIITAATINNSGSYMMKQLTSGNKLVIAFKNGSGGYEGGVLCMAGTDSVSDNTINFNADLDWDNLDNTSYDKVAAACTNIE